MEPFHPTDNATATISAGVSSQSQPVKRRPSGRYQLRIHNAAASLCFYRIGDSAVTATSADVPLPAGAVEVVTVDNRDAGADTHVAAILASGSGAVYVSTGAGL